MSAHQEHFKKSALAVAAMIVAGVTPGQQAMAANCTWNPASGNWSTSGNWSCGAVPGSADSATIITLKTVTINSNQSILTLGNAGVVNIDAGSLGLMAGGSTNNTGGVINIANGALLNQLGQGITGGTINTSGTGAVAANSNSSNILSGLTLNGLLDVATASNARERISNGMTLNGNVNIANGGFVSLDSTSVAANSIGGTGTFNLNYPGARLALEGTGTTTLGANIVVRGQGNIGTATITTGTNALVNNGRISADVVGGTLSITPGANSGGVTNNNLLDARGGGTLQLLASINNSAGLINAQTGSVVLQSGTTITGGTIGSSGTGVFRADTSPSNFLSNVTITGTLDLSSIGNSRERIINGATINGAINIANGGVLGLDSANTTGHSQAIGGTGVINLNDAAAHLSIDGNGSTTLGSGLTVRGQGSIGLASFVAGTNTLTNNGLISADVSGGTLRIDKPGDFGTFINSGTLQAINGARLLLSTNVTANAGSQIIAGAGSSVVQDGVTINGVINASGTGVFTATSSPSNFLDGVNFTGTLDLSSIVNSRERIINGATINGAINIANGGILGLDSSLTTTPTVGNQTISGTAVINLNDAAAHLSIDGNGSTTLGAGITVRGQGSIGLASFVAGTNTLTSNGLISADVSGGTLSIDKPGDFGTFINNGTLQAINGARLLLSTNVTANAGSQIVAGAGSAVVQNGVTLNGVINASGTGVFTANGGSVNFLDGVNFTGTLDLSSIVNSRERIVNGATINGAINIANGGILGLDSVNTSGHSQAIGGTGVINLNDPAAHLSIDGNGSTTLGAGITVRGQGSIGLASFVAGTNTLTSNGLISADIGGGTLSIDSPGDFGTFTNNGTLQAINGATLLLSTSINNAGQIIAGAGSTVVQNGVTLNGVIDASGTGALKAISSNANFLNGVNFTGNLDLSTIPNSHERIINGATLNGAINLGNGGILSLDSANTTGGIQALAGTAIINLNDANTRLSIEGNGTTTLGSGITVRGQGNIGVPSIGSGTNTLINNGLISADIAGGTLTLAPPGNFGSLVNNSTLQAIGGGTLLLLTNINNAAGLISAQSGSTVVQSGVTITGGTLATGGTGTFQATSSTANFLNHITLNGTLDMTTVGSSRERIINGATINGAVNVANGGILSMDSSFTTTPTAGNQTISGTGVINLNDAGARLAFEGNGSTTFAAGLTVRGQGNIGTPAIASGTHTLFNNGTILADGGTLTITSPANFGSLAGTGTLQTSGGTLNLATTGASTQGKLVMGGAGSALNLNTQNLTITNDYTNAQSGSGNSFNARAGVSGTGQILAGGGATQVINGSNITNGSTNNATLTIGNVHVGANTFNYQINDSSLTGPTLRGAIQTNVNGGNLTDARLSGSGVTASNYSSSNGPLAVTYTAASEGAQSLSGQVLNLRSNFANIGDQKLNIVLGSGAAAYNLAVGSTGDVAVANQRVGGSNTAALTVANTAPTSSFTEALNAAFAGSTGQVISTSGSITGGTGFGVAGGASNASAMTVGINTLTSGAKSGTATLNFVSNGTGSSGLGNTGVGSQTVNVTGNVYQAAAGAVQTAPLNFGTVQVGQAVSQNLVIRNTATGAAGFVEDLNASFGSASGQGSGRISGIGSLSGIVAGANSNAGNGTMTVNVNTGAAGVVNGSIAVNYVTAGAVNGVSNGLGTAAAGSENYGVAGTIQAVANVINQASPLINNTTIILGNVRMGAPSPTQAVSIDNVATVAPQAALNATVSAAAPITASGSFNLLAPGANNSSIVVGMQTGTAGAKTGTATISFVSDASNVGNCAPNCQLNLASQNVNVSGAVFRLANPTLATPTVSIATRVGDALPTRAVTITNTSPDVYTEGLKVNVSSTSGNAQGVSGIGNLAAQGSAAIQVGLASTATAGITSGSVNLGFVSTGAGTTGAADTAAQTATGTVTVNGKVYTAAVGQLATPTVDFGIVRVGDVVGARNVTVQNTAAATALNDTLRANLSGLSGPLSGNASVSGIGAQASGNIALGLNTASAGVFNQNGTMGFLSQNPDMADISAGLDASVQVKAQVNNLANADFDLLAGIGVLQQFGNDYVLNLGNIVIGSLINELLRLDNNVAGPADALKGMFNLTAADDFGYAGWNAFSGLDAGQAVGGLSVAVNAANLGQFEDKIVFDGFGYNASDEAGLAQSRNLVIRANVIDGNNQVPEPRTIALVLVALAAMGLARRRRQLRAQA